MLHERAPALGGQLRLAAAVPSRAGLLALVEHLEHQAQRLGVDVRLESEPTPDRLRTEAPDAIVLATGARPIAPPYPCDANVRVLSAWEVLGAARAPSGEQAVVIDDGTGFWEAVSVAERLGDACERVALVTPAPRVGAAIPFESISPLLARLAERAVTFHPFSRVVRVRAGGVELEHTLSGEASWLAGAVVAAHAGTVADDGLADELAGGGAVVRTIGDCVAPRRLAQATWDADRTVLELMRAGGPLRPDPRAGEKRKRPAPAPAAVDGRRRLRGLGES